MRRVPWPEPAAPKVPAPLTERVPWVTMTSRPLNALATCRFRVPLPTLVSWKMPYWLVWVSPVVVMLMVPAPPKAMPLSRSVRLLSVPTAPTMPPVMSKDADASAVIRADRLLALAVVVGSVMMPLIVLLPVTARRAPTPSMPRNVLLLFAFRRIVSATVTPPSSSRPAAKLMVTPPALVPSAPLWVTRRVP